MDLCHVIDDLCTYMLLVYSKRFFGKMKFVAGLAYDKKKSKWSALARI